MVLSLLGIMCAILSRQYIQPFQQNPIQFQEKWYKHSQIYLEEGALFALVIFFSF